MAEAIAQSPAKKPAVDQTSLITGSEAIAVACKLADVDVITGYPIRPYDTVMQYIAKLVSNGEMDCEYIIAEGEHSQFEIVKHASACGARVFCGSSGVGWMYAMEALTVTPALRIPMIAMVGMRSAGVTVSASIAYIQPTPLLPQNTRAPQALACLTISNCECSPSAMMYSQSISPLETSLAMYCMTVS